MKMRIGWLKNTKLLNRVKKKPLILSPSPVDLSAEEYLDELLHLTKHIAFDNRINIENI